MIKVFYSAVQMLFSMKINEYNEAFDPSTLTHETAIDVNLLFLQLMSQDQEWGAQTRSDENCKPGRQTIDVFDLERQILYNAYTGRQSEWIESII